MQTTKWSGFRLVPPNNTKKYKELVQLSLQVFARVHHMQEHNYTYNSAFELNMQNVYTACTHRCRCEMNTFQTLYKEYMGSQDLGINDL